MSPFFDDLEDQLRAAARAREEGDLPAPRRRGGAWLRSGARAAPIAIAVGTTVAVAVAALLLLGHQNRPSQSAAAGYGQSTLEQIIRSTPRATLRREGSYIQAATQDVHQRVCAPGSPRTKTFIHGSPGQRLLSMLAVLRRPAGPADHIGRQQFVGMPEIYAGSIRRAFVADGVSYYIAAARNDPAADLPSPHCLALEVTALHAYLPRIPASLRAPTLRLQSAFISFDRQLIAAAPRQVICTATVSRNEGGSDCGFGAAQIAAGVVPPDDNGTFTGIVPDGVATVTVSWRAAHAGVRSTTGSVVGNMYAVRAGSQTATATRVIWRSPQGQIVKTISPPSARAFARYCSKHPACAVTQIAESSSSSSGASFRGVASAPLGIAEGSSSSAAARPPSLVPGTAGGSAAGSPSVSESSSSSSATTGGSG